ncbi:MAG: nuclear transport factor 2 family protein [Saprospiraceae bacterium]|nr:nuclear transport factor 2 family protein [Saprospiraceae bacterium]
MSTLLEKISDLNDLILQGRALEAFQKYYDENVVIQENELPPTVGKPANLKRHKTFYSSITEFRLAQPLKVTVGENISMVEWQFDYTHREWGERHYTQVAVQEWRNGQIIKEKFYYNIKS